MRKTVNHNIPFLTQSPKTGVYGYRRDIAPAHRYLFPKDVSRDRTTKNPNRKTEYKTTDKTSFKTKSITVAMERYEKHHRKHEELLRLHEQSISSPEELPKEKVRRIARTLHLQGYHPDTLPQLNSLSSEEEFASLIREREYYRLYEEAEAMEIFERERAEKEYDEQHGATFSYPNEIYKDIKTNYPDKNMLDGTKGIYSAKLELEQAKDSLIDTLDAKYSDGWSRTLIPEDDELYISYQLLNGQREISIKPTLKHIKLNYLKHVINAKKMNEQSKRNKISSLNYLLGIIGNLRADGLDTVFEKLTIDELRTELEIKFPKAQTRMRRLADLTAYINCWNLHNENEKLPNPFRSLKQFAKDAIDQNEVKTRRHFTPEEFQLYWNNLLHNETDSEVRTAGLLMLYCAGPNREIFGIERRDIKLDSNIPHLFIRPNSLRLIEKGRLDRIVPLYGDILEVIREHIKSFSTPVDEETPIFPQLLKMNSKSSTGRLSKHIVNLRPELKEELVPYSSRKTMVTRADNTSIGLGLTQYITGHKAPESSRIATQFYQNPTAPDIMLRAYKELYGVKHWGYFEEFDKL